MTNFTIMNTAHGTRLLYLPFILLLLPTLSVAQWSLNIGFAAELNPLNQLNAIIDRNNHLNAPAAIPHFDLLLGQSIAIERDLKQIQLGVHCNRLKQTVSNNNDVPNHQTTLSYMNTQMGVSSEWQLCSFLGVGGTLDYNFLNINQSFKSEPSYYTESNNLLAKGFGSYRYHLHFQKRLNSYFAIRFRPYYQQSFKVVDFTLVNSILEKASIPINTVKEIPPFDAAPQRWSNWGGEITLRMFLSCKE
jgi:hypothetical protein